MLLGVATRRYARSLEPLPTDIRSCGTSKSSVSRRFVTRTTAQVKAWQTASLEALDLVAIFNDGVIFAEHCLVVALGIDVTGQKHPLGLWDGSTENATVCLGLLSNLQGRGLADGQVLHTDVEVVALAREIKQSGVPFRRIDTKLVTHDVIALGYRHRAYTFPRRA
jgi:transposase-like protein